MCPPEGRPGRVTTARNGHHAVVERDLEADLERLHDKHQKLTAELAEIAEFSARVHDEAAEVHEQLDDPQLTPEQLRDHAERDRRLAEKERQRLQES